MQIGNYVHYRFSHYRANGLSYNNGSSPSPEQAFQEQRTKLLNSLPNRGANKAIIKSTLEAQLNFFFNSNNAQSINLGFTPEEQQQLHDAIIKIFEQAMASLSVNLDGAKINYGNLHATGGQSVNVMGESVEFGKLRKSKLGGKSGRSTKESSVYRRILALIALRDSLANNNISSNFVNQVNLLEDNYGDLINELASSVGESGVIKGQGSAILQSKSMSLNTQRKKDFVSEINSLIQQTKKTTNTQVTGYLGEYIPAISQYVANQVAAKGVEECLAELSDANFNIDVIMRKVTGDKRTRKMLQKSSVIGKKGNNNATDAQVGEVGIRTNYTQDKVDVVLDLPNNETINASMKNINFAAAQKMGRGINVFSGTSILNFLQDYPTFTNHYLNITANLGRLAFDQAPAALVKKAHEEMKMTIALHALTGGVWGQQAGGAIGKTAQAEILVINDTSKRYGQFQVYFMSDILDKIQSNLDLITIDGLNESHPNWWQGELGINNNQLAFKRVANTLANLHAQKLKVSISFDTLI